MMEENAQMSLLPDVAAVTQNAAQMTLTGEEIDLSEYEIVRPEFFAHIKEPALTVNVDKIGVNTACVRLMPDVEYVQILVNRKEKKLLLKPCDEIEITGYRWGMAESRPRTRMNLEKNNVKKASSAARAGKGAECRMSGYMNAVYTMITHI